MPLLALLAFPACAVKAHATTHGKQRLSILATGAIGDGKAINTRAIQHAIDQCASEGGGTVVVPAGRFLTGALFLKPGVDLSLERRAILLGSTNITDYPSMPTRIEGHTQIWRPALLNASGCNGLQITGEGVIQGGGKPFWKAFWTRYGADNKTTNLDVERPRNLFIADSRDVLIRGISLRGSGFWNIHLYRCQNATIENVDIRTPPKSPSTDGIDVDSCQDVTIRGCHISVDDDNIALKGSKGPNAGRDTGSPPVEHIRISNCTFGLGHGVLTLGSEACNVHDVVMENCKVEGWMKANHTILLRLKLRQDTPQRYEDIHVRDITLNARGQLISIEPWNQYFDLKGQAAPRQRVNNITLSNVSGATSQFGRIAGPPKSSLSNIAFDDIGLKLGDPKVMIQKVKNLVLKNVTINGTRMDVPSLAGQGTR